MPRRIISQHPRCVFFRRGDNGISAIFPFPADRYKDTHYAEAMVENMEKLELAKQPEIRTVAYYSGEVVQVDWGPEDTGKLEKWLIQGDGKTRGKIHRNPSGAFHALRVDIPGMEGMGGIGF